MEPIRVSCLCAHPVSDFDGTGVSSFPAVYGCMCLYAGKQSKSSWKIKRAPPPRAHSASIALFVSEPAVPMHALEASALRDDDNNNNSWFLAAAGKKLAGNRLAALFIIRERGCSSWIELDLLLIWRQPLSIGAASALFAQFFFLVSFPHKTAHSKYFLAQNQFASLFILST